MNRRGFLRLPAAGALVGAVPVVAAAAPVATVTVRHPIPDCLCGWQMMVLPSEWNDRTARRMVCPNHRCGNYGKICVQSLYEVIVERDVSGVE